MKPVLEREVREAVLTGGSKVSVRAKRWKERKRFKIKASLLLMEEALQSIVEGVGSFRV